MKALVGDFKAHIEAASGRPFPDDPMEQLWGAIAAVFESWNTRRAIDYRKLHDIPDAMGTAVNIVTMVFGNLGDDSGTGVAFTRDPSTGERRLYGEYLINAQGEDVVSGARHVEQIVRAQGRRCRRRTPSWTGSRGCWSGTSATCRTWSSPSSAASSTCCRPGAASAPGQAAVRIACEMVDEGLITEEEAVARIPPNDLDQLLHPTIDQDGKLDLLTTGLPASPGAASGAVVFDADLAERAGTEERGGHPGAPGDQPGGLPRHGGRQGDPHRARRHDQSRRGGRPRHWASRASPAPRSSVVDEAARLVLA